MLDLRAPVFASMAKMLDVQSVTGDMVGLK
jgi:hypothetical protein